jgi:hypothetical protein
VGEYHTHLKEDLELILDGGRITVCETFDTVAAMNDEAFPFARFGDSAGELIYFSRKHDRRVSAYPLERR